MYVYLYTPTITHVLVSIFILVFRLCYPSPVLFRLQVLLIERFGKSLKTAKL